MVNRIFGLVRLALLGMIVLPWTMGCLEEENVQETESPVLEPGGDPSPSLPEATGGPAGEATAEPLEHAFPTYPMPVRKSELEEAEQETAELIEDVDRLLHPTGVAWRLRKTRRRTAQITVLAQEKRAETGEVVFRIRFLEVDAAGEPLDQPQEFVVADDRLFVDCAFVDLDPDYAWEEPGIYRGTCIGLFERIYTSNQAPIHGQLLDPVGEIPVVYRGDGSVSPLEKQIWEGVWDSEIPLAELRWGHASILRLRPGVTFELTMQAHKSNTVRELQPETDPADPSP